MPVTFLDGSTAEIMYPADLDLAGMGADPYGSGALYDPPLDCCARDFAFGYGEAFPLAPAGMPLKEFPGADGRPVPLLQGPPGYSDFLVFEIGEWRLGVWDKMSDETRAMWSANLSGRVSADGFPVVAATPPVRLTPLGQAYGPSLEFGHVDGNSVKFSPTRTCPPDYVEPRADELPDGVSTPVLCRAEWSMRVNIVGDRAFAERIINTLKYAMSTWPPTEPPAWQPPQPAKPAERPVSCLASGVGQSVNLRCGHTQRPDWRSPREFSRWEQCRTGGAFWQLRAEACMLT